ncbi:hypothetical protein V6S02_03475 [Microbacterium sp. CCNWLW134]|uniref:hypothetical protein n=1 Tax=Microbacterium sp. CCNWLW134 TaxID=3122064 RepID=UPI0030104471
MTNEPRMLKGEVVRWRGQPDAQVHFTRADGFFVPFSVVWLAVSILWTVAVASSSTAPRLMWLFGLLFVAFGVYGVIGRFFVKAARKRRTRYLLTDRRAIIVGPSGVQQIDLPLSERTAYIHPNRTHIDVVFGAEVGPTAGLPGMASLRTYANTGLDFFAAIGPGSPIAFYDVADVEGLEDALDSFAEGAAADRE